MEFWNNIPTWDNGTWTTTDFSSRQDFTTFLLTIFKEPGQYRFNQVTADVFNEQSRIFRQNKVYCTAPFKSKDFISYWDDQKAKCRQGIIVKDGRDEWYITRDYYMWLNFLPIFDKEQQKFDFAKIRDAQYHMALYELLAEMHYRHSAILKKRQIASSYFHAAKFINQLWFEAGVTLKMGAFEKDPTNGVGGPVKFFFHEEAGIAPKMDQTYEYIRPAMRSGMITTGMFIAAGSVGDLDQCEPLKEMVLNPEANDIYAVDTNLIDKNHTIGRSGLFIPEQWSMPPHIDEFGNSLVAEALAALDEQFITWKKELSPEQYQLRISQHPRNIEEAFAYRKASVFPQNLVAAQLRRVEEKEYSYEFLDIYRDENGLPKVKETSKLPILDFPVSKKTEDKTGTLVVWERPIKDPVFNKHYYASIDPVSEGKTTTSESLCSIYVMKATVEVQKHLAGEVQNYIEQDKIVAAWCGRFDDIKKTHEKLELIIEWYNAWTVIENNISLFIQYMISRKKQKYLVPRTQILFLKDLGANANVFQEYGWRNTGNLFKSHLISYAIEYIREGLDTITKDDGTIVKTHYGIERIPDQMLLKEMQAYQEGLNVDRLVSFAALIAFMKIQQSNRGFAKDIIMDDASKNLQKSENLYKLSHTPFRHMGKGRNVMGQSFKRSAFKNFK